MLNRAGHTAGNQDMTEKQGTKMILVGTTLWIAWGIYNQCRDNSTDRGRRRHQQR